MNKNLAKNLNRKPGLLMLPMQYRILEQFSRVIPSLMLVTVLAACGGGSLPTAPTTPTTGTNVTQPTNGSNPTTPTNPDSGTTNPGAGGNNGGTTPVSLFTLTVTSDANGIVSSTPLGINCGSECSKDFPAGTKVTLAATPASGYRLKAWTGACTTDPCVVTLSANATVGATFEPIPVTKATLTVTSGANGTVSSNPAGIDCGTDCTEAYPTGTKVTLTANPSSSYRFKAWTGACTGTAACQVAVDADATVGATFEPIPPTTATLSVTNSGNGSVSSNPAGINCGSTCSSVVTLGTQVALTATPASGNRFKEWTGACTGTGACSVTVNGNASVTASFVRATLLDFDGDGKADFSNKNLTGVWSIDYAQGGFGSFNTNLPAYGGAEATPVPADYDGDSKTDISVKTTGGTWFIDYASNGFGSWDKSFSGYGGPEYMPLPADYDGDGKTDFSTKAPDGTWFIDYASNGFGSWDKAFSGYGGPQYMPVPADYDGDGKTDFSTKALDGTWFIDYASNGFGSWDKSFSGYGGPEYMPLPADYDGDGKADFSTKALDGTWFIDYASNGFGGWDKAFAGYGGPQYMPVPADYDGDGKTDFSTKTKNGDWSIDFAANGLGGWDVVYGNYGPV